MHVDTHLIFAMILERIWYKTLPDAWSILGAVIIVGGALRVALAKQAPKTASEQAAEAKAERGGLTGSDASDDDDEEEGLDELATTGRARSGSGVANARGVDVER